MTRHHKLLALAIILGLYTSGCRDIYLDDSIDIEFNFSPITGRGDGLHTPYVLGTEVTIWANDNLNDDDEDSWTLESSDETVLRVDSHGDGSIRCTAVGEGTTEIRVFDEDGDEIYARNVEVVQPTRAELYAHGPLILGHDEEEALVEGSIKILEGGTGTFLVRYYDDDGRVYGNGVLDAQPDDQELLFLDERQSHVFEEREWLSITPYSSGVHSFNLVVNGENIGVGTVEAVTAAEVDEMVLIGESERHADDGEWLAVLAQAYDAYGEPIYGVEYSWDIDGDDEPGLGDLYRYEYDKDEEVTLGATYQGLRDEVEIHAIDGHVSSTNNIGCSAVGRPYAPAAGLLLLLLGAVLAHKRGRRISS